MQELTGVDLIAAAAFDRVRAENKGRLAWKGDVAVDLEVVPTTDAGAAQPDKAIITIRLFIYEGASIRDIKEQQLYMPAIDAEYAPAYYEAVARSVQPRVDRGDEIDVFMPHDLLPRRPFAGPTRTTVAELVDYILDQSGKNVDPTLVDLTHRDGTTPIAVNEELERAIEEDPTNVANHQVYADWLTERGDPRGELITCMLPGASPAQRRRAEQLLWQESRYFAAELMDEALEEYLDIAWGMGWVKRVRFFADWEIAQKVKDLVLNALRTLMTLPSSKMIESITIGCYDHEGTTDFNDLYEVLVEGGPRKTMRSLFFGDMESDEQEVSWVGGGTLRKLAGLYPNLTSLKIRAGSMDLQGGLDYPKLESLTIVSGGLAAQNVRAIAETVFPELRHLELWLGSAGYGGDSTIDDLAPIFTGKNLPKLETLALRNCEYTDEICKALAKAPIADQVTKLDLSKGIMTDEGARYLLEKEIFQKLETLDVEGSYLETMLPELRQRLSRPFGKEIVVTGDYQRIGDEGERYVSLSE